MQPIVLVTGPDRGGAAMWWFTRIAIRRAGGAPVRVTPSRPYAGTFSALVLGGGADVGPTHYGAERIPPKPRVRKRSRLRAVFLDFFLYPVVFISRWLMRRPAGSGIDEARDELEMSLLRHAYGNGIPVLGICRGEQLINVFFGGSLHQDLIGFYEEEPEIRTVLPRKVVELEAGSQLEAIFGRRRVLVNALHRQGVDRIGAGVTVTGRDRNRIVQAIEHTGGAFVLGVQWHPEFMPQVRTQQRLFRALVEQARHFVSVERPVAPSERRVS